MYLHMENSEKAKSRVSECLSGIRKAWAQCYLVKRKAEEGAKGEKCYCFLISTRPYFSSLLY